MAKKFSYLEQMKSGSSKIRTPFLLKAMDFYDFRTHDTKEGYFFSHDQLKDIALISVPKPHKKDGEPYVKKPYIDKCIKAIEQLIGTEEREG